MINNLIYEMISFQNIFLKIHSLTTKQTFTINKSFLIKRKSTLMRNVHFVKRLNRRAISEIFHTECVEWNFECHLHLKPQLKRNGSFVKKLINLLSEWRMLQINVLDPIQTLAPFNMSFRTKWNNEKVVVQQFLITLFALFNDLSKYSRNE